MRGLQGPDFGYQLIVRNATPDFTLTASPRHPNIPRGGRSPLTVLADRRLGYEGPIEIKVTGLSKSITAEPATILPGQDSTTLILAASAEAPGWLSAAPFKIEGRGWVAGRELVRVADPDRPLLVAALMPPPDVHVAAQPKEIVLEPGKSATVKIRIARENGFEGRVPCQIENLPPGVRVVNVGLNGVLVHSGESSHTFTLRAESWAKPIAEPIYVVGQVESNASTYHASPPILLKVEAKNQVALASRAY